MNGYEASARLRLLGITAPMVALTGHDPQTVRGAFDAAVAKGGGPRGLLDTCRRMLSQRSAA